MSDDPVIPHSPSDTAPLSTIRTRLLAVRSTPSTNMFVIAVAYGIFALSLLFQPARWGMTPAYRNLLVIMDQRAWGTCFAVVTAMLAAALWKGRTYRWLSVLALSLGLAITTTWVTAFVIRWLTSSATTPETWVSWAVFDFLLFRAFLLLGYEEVRIRIGGEGG